MDAHCQAIMDEYLAKQESFKKLKDIVLSKLKELVDENHMIVNAVEGRVKAQDSLEGKLELKGHKYNSLADITDIFGARVVTFYTEDVDKIASLVEQNFIIDWENSVDKRKMLKSDQFGYMSLHYICSVPKTMYDDPEHPEINEFKFEIQMRTTLQHVWATAYHDTGYKSDIEVPKEYIRALTRLAGVLEIADEQFSQIVGELAEYRRKVRNLVKDGKYEDLDLDADSFGNYMEIGPFDKLNEKIAAINHAEIQYNSPRPYLPILKRIGFSTIADIEQLKKDYAEAAYQLALYQMSGTDLDIISSTIGLQNMCLIYLANNGGGVAALKRFYDNLYGERPRNEVSARRTLETITKLNLIKTPDAE